MTRPLASSPFAPARAARTQDDSDRTRTRTDRLAMMTIFANPPPSSASAYVANIAYDASRLLSGVRRSARAPDLGLSALAAHARVRPVATRELEPSCS